MNDRDQAGILDEDPEDEDEDGGKLEGLLDSLCEAGEEKVSVHDVIGAFEHRSAGALIAAIGVIAALPIVGGIPGVSIATATLILLVVAQTFFSRSGGVWVPDFLGKREIDSDTVENATEKARPFARGVDRWLRPRMGYLTHGRVQRMALIGTIALLAITFYPLAFIPYGVTAPSIGVLAMGLALMTGDGLLALIGYAMIAATVATGILIM